MLIARPAHSSPRRSLALAWRGLRSRERALELAALAAIVLAGLFLRTYALEALPFGLHGDEAVSGLEARRILREGNIGPYSPEALGMPSGPLYLIAIGVRLFGDSAFAVRIIPAILGALTILALFVVVRRHAGPTAALCAAALLATQGWHLHFSRLGFPVASWPLCVIITTGVLLEATRRWDWRWWLAGGALLGVGLYSYNSHVLFIAIAGLFVGGALVARCARGLRRQDLAATILPLLALPAALLLLAAPLLHYASDPAHNFTSRFNSVSLQQQPAWQALDGPAARAGFLAARYAHYWDALCCHPNPDGADGSGAVPFVPPLVLALVAAGAAIGCLRRRSRAFAAFGLLVIALQPLGAVLTVDGAMRRTLIIAPFVAAFAALALTWPLDFVRARWGAARGRVVFTPVLGLASAAIVALLAWGAMVDYFDRFPHTQETHWTFGEEMTEAARFLDTLPPGSRVLFASGRWSGNYETRLFLAPGVVVEDRSLEYGQRTDLTVEPEDGPVTVVLLGEYIARLDDVRARYPGGATVAGGAADDPSFVAYRIAGRAAAP